MICCFLFDIFFFFCYYYIGSLEIQISNKEKGVSNTYYGYVLLVLKMQKNQTKQKQKNNIPITKIIMILLLLGFVAYIFYMVISQSLTKRVASYAQYDVYNKYNEVATATAADKEAKKLEYLAKSLAVRNGYFINTPILSFDSETATQKPTDTEFLKDNKLEINFDIYPVSIPTSKDDKGYGYVIYFNTLKFTDKSTTIDYVKQAAEYAAKSDKDRKAQEPLKNVLLSKIIFDKTSTAYETYQPISPATPLIIPVSQLAEKDKINQFEISVLKGVDKSSFDAKTGKLTNTSKSLPLLQFVGSEDNKRGDVARVFQMNNLDTELSAKLNAAFSGKTDKISTLDQVKQLKAGDVVHIKADLSKHNGGVIKTAVITSVIVLLVFYIMFGHKYVKAALKKKKTATNGKQNHSEQPLKPEVVEQDVKEASFEDIAQEDTKSEDK